MQQDHYQKIENLVKASGILSQPEKNDWLGLLELMNDRQLLELERILSSAQPLAASPVIKKVFPAAPVAIPQKPVAPIPPKPAVPKSSPFSHILNLPQSSVVKGVKSASVQPQVESKQLPTKKESPFMARLKNIFSEKELPPAKLEQLAPPQPNVTKLDYPKAVTPPQKPKIEPRPVPKPEAPPKTENVTINLIVNSAKDLEKLPGFEQANQALKSAFNKPVPEQPQQPAPEKKPVPEQNIARPAPVVPPAPKPIPKENFRIADRKPPAPSVLPRQSEESRPAPVVPEAFNLPKAPQEQAPAGQPAFQEQGPGLEQVMKEAEKRRGAAENVAAGLNFPQFSLGDILKDNKNAKPAQIPTLPSRAAKVVMAERPGDDMKLGTLAEVMALSPSDLQQHASGTFFKKLNALIHSYGYHEVEFSLEKSPLYKSYIATGLAMMEGSPTEGKKTAQGQDYLSRPDFEHFADLLIVLQSKV